MLHFLIITQSLHVQIIVFFITKVSNRVEDSKFIYHMHPFLTVILRRVTKDIITHYDPLH